MAAIRFATNPQQWSVSIRDSISNEPHDKSNSRFVGCICIRPVDDGAVVQGHLAWLQYDVYCLGFIDAGFDSLTTRYQIGIVPDIDVTHQALLMGPRDHAHAAVGAVARGECDPG
jgi:hypothetical protein